MLIAYNLTRTKKIAKRLGGKYNYINKSAEIFDKSELLTILGDNNEILRAHYYKANDSHKYVILVPSYLGDNKSTNYACKIFMEKGYNCLSINNRGTSKKAGKNISFGFYENYDLQCWFNYILKKDKQAKVGLFGEGMGASTALMCAGDIPEIQFVISYNAYFSLEKLIETNMAKYKFFIEPTKWFLRHFMKVYVEQINPDIWARKAKAKLIIINDDSILINSGIQNEYIKDMDVEYIKIKGQHLKGLREDNQILKDIVDKIELSN